jgi:hypothetical protein
MKKCYECGHVTGGEPLFCQFCGRTYDMKLCPRMHVNPRFAEVCSQCGSRDLSTPQPKVSLWKRMRVVLVKIMLGVLLVLGSLALLVAALLRREVHEGLIALALLVGVLWFLWSMLPNWFRAFIRWFLKKGTKKRKDRHER